MILSPTAIGEIQKNNSAGAILWMLFQGKSLYFAYEILESEMIPGVKVLSVKKQWNEILACSCTPDLETVIFGEPTNKDSLIDNIRATPPSSSAGKLLAILFQRFKHFKGAPDKGVAIISYDTADKTKALEAIILELAHLNNLEPSFLDWIENSTRFVLK